MSDSEGNFALIKYRNKYVKNSKAKKINYYLFTVCEMFFKNITEVPGHVESSM